MEKEKIERYVNERFGPNCLGYVIHDDLRKVTLTCMEFGKEKYFEISFDEITG